MSGLRTADVGGGTPRIEGPSSLPFYKNQLMSSCWIFVFIRLSRNCTVTYGPRIYKPSYMPFLVMPLPLQRSIISYSNVSSGIDVLGMHAASGRSPAPMGFPSRIRHPYEHPCHHLSTHHPKRRDSAASLVRHLHLLFTPLHPDSHSLTIDP